MKLITRILSFALFLSLLLPTILHAQCEYRYQEEIFDSVSVETVIYSNVSGFEIDIYQAVGDTFPNRPLLIFGHSGAFFTGSKDVDFMKSTCNYFAKRGYVTASFQYSLASSAQAIQDSIFLIGQMVEAVSDGKAAVRFMRKTAANGNVYGIDSSQIWMGGSSAGAMLALQLAFLDENDAIPSYMQTFIDAQGGFEGNKGNPNYSSEIKGVINLAGAIIDPNWIAADETESLVSCHGSDDSIVDFECDDLFWNFGIFAATDYLDYCGSGPIHLSADAAGLDNSLLVMQGLDHVPWEFDSISNAIAMLYVQEFLFSRVACNPDACELDLEINGGLIDAGIYQASHTIESNGFVEAGNEVIFQAGITICLNPGFEVKPNSEFSAIINPCTDFSQ